MRHLRPHWRMLLLASLALLCSAAPAAVLAAPAAPSDASLSTVALASEAASRASAASAPVIDAPVSASVATDQSLTLTATATDPDAADLLTITATGAPGGLVFNHTPSVSPATATLSGTPGSGDVGSWTIDWQVSDGSLTANTTTSLTVVENHPPIISAPAVVPGAVSVEMEFAVLVSDPDGDDVTSITSTALPAGATFVPNGLFTSGVFNWTPAVGQQGNYNITFSAMSGSPGRAADNVTTMLTIGPQDLIPVIVAPGTVNGRANHLITFTATCTDPLGEAITFFNLTGSQNTPLPDGATWTTNAAKSVGTFTWTPTMAQVGTVNLRYRATDAEPFPLQVGPEQYTTKIIVSADRAPAVTAPATVAGAEGSPLAVNVTAADPDGDAIASLAASGLPFGATFSSNPAHTAGTVDWTPDFSQAGAYTFTFTASNLLAGSAASAVNVADVNRPPTANAGGPYSGVASFPVAFDGSASSDPDGNALTYAWDFGDGGSASGQKPNHVYATGGAYAVSLTVTDTGISPLSDGDNTTATISSVFDVRIFTQNSYRSIKLQAGKPFWCAQVEPIGGNFNVGDVIASSVVLQYGGQEIHAVTDKGSIVSDSDKNGIDEIMACFAKNDLRTLFAGLPNGHNDVTVTIQGSLLSGALVRGTTTVDVFASGGALLAAVSPNPFNPEATMTFVTRKPGALRVRLYDIHGRLVKTLADEANANPGNHDLHINGRADDESSLSSGTYFFRIEAADGQATGRISLVK